MLVFPVFESSLEFSGLNLFPFHIMMLSGLFLFCLVGFENMAYRKWNINGHVIELEHGWWSGTAKVIVDGQLEITRPSPLLYMDYGFSHRFEIEGVPFVVCVICQIFKFRYELLANDDARNTVDSVWLHLEFPLSQLIGFFISFVFLLACLVAFIDWLCKF